MKGIVLAGGSGSDFPIPKGLQANVPIFDNQWFIILLSLMLAGIREILIPHPDLPGFKRLLGDGSDYGGS